MTCSFPAITIIGRSTSEFVANVPLSLPADAVFTNLGGSARETGLGMSVSRFIEDGRLAGWRWTAGALWQRLELSNYSSPYVVLAGPSAGATGIDRLQLEVVVHHALRRSVTPDRARALDDRAALPRWRCHYQRRGVQGRITGDGFDLSGNSADNGHSKNYGDPSPVIGMVVRYEPWGLEVDIGAALTEALLEPRDGTKASTRTSRFLWPGSSEFRLPRRRIASAVVQARPLLHPSNAESPGCRQAADGRLLSP